MDRAVRESVMIALSLVVFGVFMSFVGYLGYTGYSMRVSQQNHFAFQQSLQARRSLEFYANTDVTRDDVLIAVQRYTQKYDIYVLPYGITDPSYSGGIALTKADSLSAWDVSKVDSEMQSKIDGSQFKSGNPVMYKARLIKDPYAGNITGIEFTLETH